MKYKDLKAQIEALGIKDEDEMEIAVHGSNPYQWFPTKGEVRFDASRMLDRVWRVPFYVFTNLSVRIT